MHIQISLGNKYLLKLTILFIYLFIFDQICSTEAFHV